ncbi:MAG TPA: hypothetical protein VD815_01210 [Candidatus Saccharimonadales bacterium]|nr:hypothetical protein [Candidatus Saccharimonadales bacterium]
MFQTYNETEEVDSEPDCIEEKCIFFNDSKYDFTKKQADDLMQCLMGIGLIRFYEDGWHIKVIPH